MEELKKFEVGSEAYYIHVIQLCNQGTQCCTSCPMVTCGDNMHPHQVAALQRTILDYANTVWKLKQKLNRKEELERSMIEVIRRLQEDAQKRSEDEQD
jgi:hypothetical protein